MAIYIAIRKLDESDTTATYSFGVAEDKAGRVEIDKTTGEVHVVDQAPNDGSSRIFSRVARKLRQHWEKGEYPDSTCWAC
jgi:hypothetical protein